MNTIEDLRTKIDQIVPLIYVLSDDEHRAITGIASIAMKKKVAVETFVYKSTTGIIDYNEYIKDIDEKKYTSNTKTQEVNDALMHIYKQNKAKTIQLFILTEADNLLEDEQVVRRLKDFAIQADNCDGNLKIVILLSSQLYLPSKIEKYLDVIVYPYPDEEEIKSTIKEWTSKFNKVLPPGQTIKVRTDFEIVNALKGLIVPQICHAITACLTATHKKDGKRRLDAEILSSLKREIINKTKMLQLREPKISFKEVAGLGRLKHWFNKSYGGWTTEGQEFGLPLLKGALLLGLPGCGKSRISEALANEWKLNLVQFDPSTVYSSRVGESEGNMRNVIAKVEALAPCILFIDEVEKGFSGSQSSTFSDAGTTDRTLGIFLIWLNDHESAVFNVSTCNKIYHLPPELISRYDEIFYVGPPSENERKEHVSIQLKEQGNKDAKDFDISRLAKSSEDLSGREIMQAVKESMYDAYHSDDKKLTNDIIEEALRRKTPIVKTMGPQLEHLIKWVGHDQERNDGVRARFANDNDDDIDRLFADVLQKAKSKDNVNDDDIDLNKPPLPELPESP